MLSSQIHALLCWLSFCLCCFGRQSESPATNTELERANDGPPGLFRHRHSFGYELNHHEASAFRIMDAADVLDAFSVDAKPVTFNLRAHYDASSNHADVYDQTRASEHRHPEAPPRSSTYMPTPNTTDKETVVNLAKMTSDAYLFDPREPDWLNTSLGFNFTSRLPWKDDGLRGHVFSTEDYSIVVVSFKGTTIDPRDKLSGRDAINDNRLFSCCCRAQNSYRYPPICDCATGYYQCNSNCLTTALLQNDSYYNAAMYVMGRIHNMYPNAAFWVVGHSLGGSLASLVGMTVNIPAVTFEAPPERLPAERMGLIPPRHNMTAKGARAMAHHFGNTADPVYMGVCNGFLSTCSFWGLSFESQCFTGKRCDYDTVKDKGWRSSIANHRINYVIENVLEAYDDVPRCEEEVDCEDCYLWKFS